MSNHQNKLVSIGLPTYNRGYYLGGALNSLLSQTHANFELIISDNVSTDDTQKICEEYAKKDERIKYFRQNKNIGVFKNFKFVLQQAKGGYFMWASDDDIWEPTFVSELSSLLSATPYAVLAMSRIVNINAEGVPYSMRTEFIDTRGMTYFKRISNILYRCPPDYFCGLYRTTALSEILNAKLFSSRDLEDYTLLLLKSHTILWLASNKGDIITSPKPLFYKRNHPEASDSDIKSHKISSFFLYFINTCRSYDFSKMTFAQKLLINVLSARLCMQIYTVYYLKNSLLRRFIRGILFFFDCILQKMLKI